MLDFALHVLAGGVAYLAITGIAWLCGYRITLVRRKPARPAANSGGVPGSSR